MDDDNRNMKLAFRLSRYGTCLRARVGCMIVMPNGATAIGWNDSPGNMPSCTDDGACDIGAAGGCQRTVHAEANAIIDARGYEPWKRVPKDLITTTSTRVFGMYLSHEGPELIHEESNFVKFSEEK